MLEREHRGRWLAKLQVRGQQRQRQAGQRPFMTPAGSQATPGCIAGRPACVEPSMPSDPDRRRVPQTGDDSKNGEDGAPANRAQVPAHRAGRRASPCVTKDSQPLGAGGQAALPPHLGRPPTLPRPRDPGAAGNPVRTIHGRPAARLVSLGTPDVSHPGEDVGGAGIRVPIAGLPQQVSPAQSLHQARPGPGQCCAWTAIPA
jgi:hypothetical protein